MIMIRKKWPSPLSLLLVAAAWAHLASATAYAGPTYAFNTNVTNTQSANTTNQFQVEVAAGGAGQVTFTFTNNVGITSSITDVYFQDGTLLGIASVTGSGRVHLTAVAIPSDLP